MGKKIILMILTLMLTVGCSHKTEKEDTGIAFPIDDFINKLEEIKLSDESQENDEKNDGGKSDSDKKSSNDSKSDSTENQQSSSKPASNQNKDDNQPTSQQPSNNGNGGGSGGNGGTSGGSKPSQPQETPKPSEPEKPPVSTCDDTLPAGAYTDEEKMDADAQKKVMDSIMNGQGVSGYEVEYGYTECGTRYCIPIYY